MFSPDPFVQIQRVVEGYFEGRQKPDRFAESNNLRARSRLLKAQAASLQAQADKLLDTADDLDEKAFDITDRILKAGMQR